MRADEDIHIKGSQSLHRSNVRVSIRQGQTAAGQANSIVGYAWAPAFQSLSVVEETGKQVGLQTSI